MDSDSPWRRRSSGYLVAVLGTALAALVRWAASDVLAPTTYLIFYPVVVAAAALGGLGPGLVATFLSAFAADLFFDVVPGQHFWNDAPTLVRQLIFLAGGIGISVIAEAARASQTRSRIDARKSADMAAALQQSQRSLELAIEGSQLGIWEMDAATGELTWSERCRAMLGAPEQGVLTYDYFLSIVHPDDRSAVDHAVSEALTRHQDYRAEMRIIWGDGSVHWISARGRAAYDEKGQPVRMSGVAIDITDLKRAEESVRKSEERQRLAADELRAVMEATPAGICVAYDPECHLITGNRPAHELLGIPEGENFSATPNGREGSEWFRMFRDGRELSGSELPMQLACVTGKAVTDAEVEIVRADGSRRVCLLNAAPLYAPDGTVRGSIAAFTDITARKLAEEALRESELHYRTLFNSIDEGFCIVEVIFDEGGNPIDYRFLETNPSFERQTGMADAAGRRMRELVPLHEEHWFRTYGAVAQTGQPIRFEAQALGLGRWYDVYACRWGNPEDRQVAVLFSDMTNRKRAEQELIDAKASAERAKAAAEEASRAKDHFLAVLSHELRTPLTPVLATAIMMEEDQSLSPEARRDVTVMRRNVELEARLIDDLLDVTRIARGKLELDRRPVLMCEVLQQTVDVCMPDITARQLHFGLNIKDPPILVHADSARLQQVFWNLIKNAVKFTPQAGCVGVRCWREGADVIVEVSDSGQGIEPEALHRIFNAFEQAKRSAAMRFGGLGLGLTISKAMVELHGGTISAHSDGPGSGATFTVRLPLYVAEPLDASPAPRAAAPTVPIGRRILLVEDHGDTAQVMCRLITREGHEVRAAGDLASALKLIDGAHFDLLISDLGLPDGSGLDLIGELRRRGNPLPAIALSGYGQEEDVHRSLEAGFAAHLTKPVNIGRLKVAMAEALGGKRFRAPLAHQLRSEEDGQPEQPKGSSDPADPTQPAQAIGR